MKTSLEWLERQYWADVMAVRPSERIEQQQQASAQVRAKTALIDQPYGGHERQRLDLFVPTGDGPFPLLAFVHGGYWQLGHKDDWAFLAPGWQEKGIAYATIGYRLAPEAPLAEISADVGAALSEILARRAAWKIDEQKVVVAGISAGAQLAAMNTAFAEGGLSCGAVLLSGVYDLMPLAGTTPGKVIGEIAPASHSPLVLAPNPGCKTLVAYGGDETDVFKSQSRALAAHLSNHGYPTDAHELPGANHFTVVDALRADSSGVVHAFVTDQLAAA